MRIGIIGSGTVGGSLGTGWAQHGNEVMFSSREPGSAAIQALLAQAGANARAGTASETLAFGEVIAVAVRWDYLPGVVTSAGDWAGKVVIDATNRFGASPSGRSAAEDLAALLPGAHVVKAFNTIGAEHMPHGHINGEQLSMFIAGDSAGKPAVARLVEQLGFSVVDVGGLDKARVVENLAELWVTLARGGLGRGFGFRLVRGDSR
jgi:predicted dinucleotide-binding enzyme